MALECLLRGAVSYVDNELRGSAYSEDKEYAPKGKPCASPAGQPGDIFSKTFQSVSDTVEAGLQLSNGIRGGAANPHSARIQQVLQRAEMESLGEPPKAQGLLWSLQRSASAAQGCDSPKQALRASLSGLTLAASSSSSNLQLLLEQQQQQAESPRRFMMQQRQQLQYGDGLAPFLVVVEPQQQHHHRLPSSGGSGDYGASSCSSMQACFPSHTTSHSTCASGLSNVSYSSSCTSMSTNSSRGMTRQQSCSSSLASSGSHCHLAAEAAALGCGAGCTSSGSSSSSCGWVLPQYANTQVLSAYEFGKQLGVGTFGVTRLVRDRSSAAAAACKSICKAHVAGNQTLMQDIRREVAIMEHLAGHSSVVNLRGVYEDARQVHLVMDLCTGGDLHEFISRCPRAQLKEQDAAAVAKSMLEALAFCHARGVVHRDVKPENFLLEKTGSVQAGVKVSDFGVSAWHHPGELLSEIVGTPYYMAPEVIQRCYGTEADVWSAGVVLYLMLTGRLPFNGHSDRQVVRAVLASEPDYTPRAWAGVSSAAQAVVKAMLVKDPRQRASISKLLQMPWFEQFGLASSSSSAGAAPAAAEAPAGAAAATASASSSGRSNSSSSSSMRVGSVASIRTGSSCSTASPFAAAAASSSSSSSSSSLGSPKPLRLPDKPVCLSPGACAGWQDSPRAKFGKPSSEEAAGLAALLGLGSGSFY